MAEKQKKAWMAIFWGIMAAGLLFRLLLAAQSDGFTSDVNCFAAWSDRVVDTGFAGFYSDTVFTDYPPGYMYILYLIGLIRQYFTGTGMHAGNLVLVKLPAILCDIGIGFLLYRIGKKCSKPASLLLLSLFLFNPAVWINSTVWGQVDSIFTLCLLAACYLATEEKTIPSYFVFAAGVLIKPQTLIFTPVFLLAFWQQIGGKKRFCGKEFGKQLAGGMGALAAVVLGMLPFGLWKVIVQYTDTLTSYPYASVNAFNFWNLIGFNWVSQDEIFLFLPCKVWGSFFILLTVLIACLLFYRFRNRKERFYITAAAIIGGMFLFSVRMHERYLFPILILLLAAYLVSQKRAYMNSYLLLSLAHFANVFYVLYWYDANSYNRFAPIPILISLLTLFCYGYMLFSAFRISGEKEENGREFLGSHHEKRGAGEREKKRSEDEIFLSKKKDPLTKKDVLLMGVITAIYALVAFYDLGDRRAPDRFWVSGQAGEQAIFDLGSSQSVSRMAYYLGNYEERRFSLEIAEALEGPYQAINEELTMDSVFSWGETEVDSQGRYLRLISLSDKASVGEIIFLNGSGEVVPVKNVDNAELLCDEQEKYPGRKSFRNSTYFDEIYHARTAYEYLHGLYSYENTHPPLGKIFIATGMYLFGENPFGWRFMGTLFGVLMLPVLYLLAKLLFRNTFLSAVVTVLFAVDFMHFAQTRIATIDVFVTLFIMLMYYFMYSYRMLSFYDTKLSKTFVPLGLSGLCMGLGVASKWTGAYAGLGLAVLFFWQIGVRYQEYRYARQYPGGSTNGISHAQVLLEFRPKLIKTLLFCLLFFIIIPAGIYTLSYLPFSDGSGSGLIERMLKNQETMLRYHTHVEATHPFSSRWYQWPILYRPIWYYSGTVSATIKEGISSFGNPMIWWLGIAAFGYLLFRCVRRRDQLAIALCISYLAQYVPWFFVKRLTFIYHYFPCVPFVILMIGYGMFLLIKKYNSRAKTAIASYTVLAAALFAMFYPVLSGQAVSVAYVQNWLTWLKSWILI